MSSKNNGLKFVIIAVVVAVACCCILSSSSIGLVALSPNVAQEADIPYDNNNNNNYDPADQLVQDIINSSMQPPLDDNSYSVEEPEEPTKQKQQESSKGSQTATVKKSDVKLVNEKSTGKQYVVYKGKNLLIAKGGVKKQGDDILVTLTSGNKILIKA